MSAVQESRSNVREKYMATVLWPASRPIRQVPEQESPTYCSYKAGVLFPSRESTNGPGLW